MQLKPFPHAYNTVRLMYLCAPKTMWSLAWYAWRQGCDPVLVFWDGPRVAFAPGHRLEIIDRLLQVPGGMR